MRRDLRARVISAVVSVFVLTGLAWLGLSALTRVDSQPAHVLRVQLGLERPFAVCGPELPRCTYDDREQADIDREFARERSLRTAVLDELSGRIDRALARLDASEELVLSMPVDEGGALAMDTTELRALLVAAAVDLRPAEIPVELSLDPFTDGRAVRPAIKREQALLWPLNVPTSSCTREFDGLGWINECELIAGIGRRVAPSREPDFDARDALYDEVARQRAELRALATRIEHMRRRDVGIAPDAASVDRYATIAGLSSGLQLEHTSSVLAAWLMVAPEQAELSSLAHEIASVVPEDLPAVGSRLAALAGNETPLLEELVTNPDADVWRGGWDHDRSALRKPAVRYRSPVTDSTRWRLLGATLLCLAGIMLVVVGPVVTATTTAREREAGTLPVLRMTGLSARDLAMAVGVGPNVFALVAGGLMLAVAVMMLAPTAGVAALAKPLALLAVLCVATHLTAIGLGDALGHRVNAMVVGGLMALAVLGPGLIGTVVVVADLAATGVLLGPLPAVLSEALGTAGLALPLATAHPSMGSTMLGYAVFSQGLLGLACLASWQRRVERAWAPLFRPAEGILLGVVSVGCSALAILDLSERLRVSDYDTANLITFVSTGFLMPMLAWLLVASLRRPARASAVSSHVEARRAFWRFQGLVVLAAAIIGCAYWLVMQRTGLGREESELMWATLTQWLLVAETAVATLLWMSRKRHGRHRVAVVGGALVLLQIAFAVFVYGLEVEHVAFHHEGAMPFLVGMDVSPYWLAFLAILWAAGLGLIIAALVRERQQARAEEQAEAEADAEDDEDGDNGETPRRWLH